MTENQPPNKSAVVTTPKHTAMQVSRGSEVKAPCIPNFGTRWIWLISSAVWPLCLLEKSFPVLTW